MSAIFAEFIAPVLPWIIAGAGIIWAFITHGRAQKKIGAAEAKVDAANATSQEHEAIATQQVNAERADSTATQQAIERADNATKTVLTGNTGDAASELRDKWSRD